MTIGELWGHFANPANWREGEGCATLLVDDYYVYVSSLGDRWFWAIYWGEPSEHSPGDQSLWSKAMVGAEEEARMGACLALMGLINGPVVLH